MIAEPDEGYWNAVFADEPLLEESSSSDTVSDQEPVALTAGTAKPTAEPSDEVHHGQVRFAYRLERASADKLMFVHGIGWYAYDGTRWAPDDQGHATRAVVDVLRNAHAEAFDDKKLQKDIARCESAAGIAGVLQIASALETFAVTVRDLDADPWLLNVGNGTVDLRNRQLRPHNPADRCTKITNADFDPERPRDQWEAVLQTALPDKPVSGFFQRLVGLGLLGEVREHVLGILTGTGANSKSVITRTIHHALGDYALTAEPDLFMHRDGAHPTGEMDLLGRRWVSVSETEKDRRLAEATMKRLTGGDRIRARRMRQDFVEFQPSHTAILVTNHLPKVSGDDPAIWRRLRVIPFEVVIPEHQRDPALSARLEAHTASVLAWAIEGLADYLKHGLNEPDAVMAATDNYRRSSDAITRFIDECCLVNPHRCATTRDLHARYVVWAQEDGAEPMSSKALGLAFDRAGYPASPPRNGRRLRRGIGLQSDKKDDENGDDS